MRRQGVVTLLLAVVLGAPLAAGCRGSDVVAPAREDPQTLGILRLVPDEDHDAFVDELRRQGWEPGRDVRILPEDPAELYPDADAAGAALEDWRREGLDVLVAFSTPFAALAAEVAPGLPTLFVVNDPVASGLVGDLRRPDLGMTGVTFRTPADRTLDLASRMLGGIDRVGYLAPATDPAVPGHRAAVLAAAEELGLEVVERSFATPDDVAAAVDELAAAGVEVVVVPSSNSTVAAAAELQAELDRAGLPVVANSDLLDFAVLVVTPDGPELRRQLARQAARILGGADVASVPVEHPRKFQVIMHRTKAAELGLPPVDPEVLRLADVVR